MYAQPSPAPSGVPATRKRGPRPTAAPPPPSPRATPPLGPDGAPLRPFITASSPCWTRPEENQCGVGAILMVPTHVYPAHACDENGGWGWSAKVVARK
eukprot:5755743-Pleurochrysis_carterae.AAC.1